MKMTLHVRGISVNWRLLEEDIELGSHYSWVVDMLLQEEGTMVVLILQVEGRCQHAFMVIQQGYIGCYQPIATTLHVTTTINKDLFITSIEIALPV